MVTFSLRLKDDEYNKIKQISEENDRSINKQLENII